MDFKINGYVLLPSSCSNRCFDFVPRKYLASLLFWGGPETKPASKPAMDGNGWQWTAMDGNGRNGIDGFCCQTLVCHFITLYMNTHTGKRHDRVNSKVVRAGAWEWILGPNLDAWLDRK